jgi:hypothetical protein
MEDTSNIETTQLSKNDQIVKAKPDVIEDPMIEPLEKSSSGSATKPRDPPDNSKNPLSLGLGLAFDETGTAALDTKLEQWRPRILKVTDPVAFMTSGTEKSSSGSYDKAINDRKSADGFYELAKSECALLISEIEGAAGGELTAAQRSELSNLTAFLASYAALYGKLQTTGTSSSADKRAEMTGTVQGALITAQGLLSEISDDVLGGGTARIEQSLGEISLFVASWSTISSGSEHNNASSLMWASFLQTMERYRNILNNYDKLEARGGDTTKTSKMAMRREDGSTIVDGDEADKQAGERGGYMAEALRSYNFYAADAAKYVEQLKAIMAKLKAGEYETEEQCVAAFRAAVGSGGASELFYKNLDEVAKGKWSTYQTSIEAKLSKADYTESGKNQDKAAQHIGNVDKISKDRDQSAKSREDNLAYLGMDQAGRDLLYERYINGEIDVVQLDVADKIAMRDRMLKEQFVAEQEEIAAQKERESDPFYIAPAVAESTAVYQAPIKMLHQGPSKDEIVDGLFSDQESSYMQMDKTGTEEAYDQALKFQKLAQDELSKAQESAQDAQAFISSGYEHAVKAQWYLAQARLHRNYIKGDHPALLEGISSIDGDIKVLTKTLNDNEDLRQQLLANQSSLESIIAQKTKSLGEYNPEQLKVPMPSATVNGVKLEVEKYQQVTIDLSGPAFGVFWWIGGVKGVYSQTSEIGKEDVWHKASIEAYAGLKADLWLAEAGVKVLGFFEARKKNADGLEDTIESGIEELGRWAYAWWYDLDGLSDNVAAPINMAITRGQSIYNDLLGTDLGQLDGKIKQGETEMMQLQQLLALGLIGAYSSDKGETGFDAGDALDVSTKIMPIEEILAGLEDLKGREGEELDQQIRSDRDWFTEGAVGARDETTKEIAKVDPGTNDKNVEFEAGVGIEGFAGFKAGKLSVKAGYRRVYSVSDGKGDDFDYSVKKKDSFTLSGEYKGGKLSISVSPQGDGYEIGVDAAIPVASSSDVDGSGILVELQDKMLASKGLSVLDWADRVDDIFRKELDFDDVFKTELSSKVLTKIGGKIKLTDDFDIDGGSVYLGLATLLSYGNKSIKATYEQGSKVTLKFPSAKEKKKKLEEDYLKTMEATD